MTHSLVPDDLLDLQTPTELAVSPTGDRIAFIVVESDPDADQKRRSLFVVSTDGTHDPHRVTRVADAESPTWGPDGTRLAFIASRERDVELAVGSEDEDATDRDEDEKTNGTASENGNDEPKPQIWVFDMALGGDARQVTDFEEGVNEFDWGPNGDRIVVAARDPTDDQREYLEDIREKSSPYEITRIQHKVDGAGYTDDVTTYLFVVDTETREPTRLDDAYGCGAREAFSGLSPTWGPSDRIAFQTYRGPDPDETYVQDAYMISPDGSDLQQVTDGDLTTAGFQWSPDGSRLAFYGSDPENVYKPTEVYVVDGVRDASSEITYRSISHSLDRTVSWAGCATWLSDDALLAPIGDEGRTTLVRLDANRDAPERVFDGLGTERTITHFDASADQVGLCLSHPNHGHDVFASDIESILDGGRPTSLSTLNADLLTDAALPTCERVYFENDDASEVEGLAYLPADFENEDPDPRPLICYIHGGPTAYDAPRFDFDYSYWTENGYIVLNVNYRGSTSYGRAFSETINGDWGPREANDIISGVEHLIDLGWADPDRLFCSGFSQGGINTLYVVTRTDMFCAAAPEHGIYDFYSNFGTADMHQWYVNENGVPWKNEEQYRTMSSLIDVGEISTPLLVMAGENDWRCPLSQAEQLYVSAKRAGIEAKLIVYQDEHHNVGDPKRGVHRLKELTEWFETHDPTREN